MLKFVFVVGHKHPWGINPTSPPVFIHTCQGAEIFEINGIYSRDGLIQVRGKLPNSSMLICVVCCVFCILDMHLFFLFRLGICLKNLWFTIKSKNSALQTFNEDTCFFFQYCCQHFRWIQVCDKKLDDNMVPFFQFPCCLVITRACYAPWYHVQISACTEIQYEAKNITSSLVPVFFTCQQTESIQ